MTGVNNYEDIHRSKPQGSRFDRHLLVLSGYTATQAISSDAPSGRVAGAGSASVQSVNGGAHLIIHRIANLGNRLIVDLRIDGAPVASIGYGHIYDGILSP